MPWNVSEEFRNGCYDDSKKKRIVFASPDMSLSNEDIDVSQGVTFDLASCTNQQITFGETPSNSCSVTVLNDEGAIDGNTLASSEFKCHIGVEVDNLVYDAPENALSAIQVNGSENISVHTGTAKTVSGSLVSFETSAHSGVTSLVCNIVPTLNGVSSVEVAQTGVNIIDGDFVLGWIANDGTYHSNYTDRIATTKYYPVVGGQSYYFMCDKNWRYCFYDENFATIDGANSYTAPRVIQAPANAKYLRVASPVPSIEYMCVNYPSTITARQPYSTPTITVALGQTVYGGHIDIISGLLSIEYVNFVLESIQWTSRPVGGVYCWRAENWTTENLKLPTNGSIFDGVCDTYTPIRFNGVSANVNTIALRDNGWLHVNNGSTSISPTGHVTIALAEPKTVQLTPQEINTLLGTNNIWCNTGDISVTYGSGYIKSNAQFDSVSPDVLKGYDTKMLYLYGNLYFISVNGNDRYYAKNERLAPFHYGEYEYPTQFECVMLDRFFDKSANRAIAYCDNYIYEYAFDSNHAVSTTWQNLKAITWQDAKANTWAFFGGYTRFTGTKYETVPYGVWKFDRPRRVVESVLTLSGHDKMIMFDEDSVDFCNNATSTLVSIRNYIKQIAAYKGVGVGDLSGLNNLADEIMINPKDYYQYKTLKDMLSYAFEVGASNCIIDREGNISAMSASADELELPFAFSFDVADSSAHTIGKALVYRQGDYSLYQEDATVSDGATYEWHDNPLFNKSNVSASWFSNGMHKKYGGFHDAITVTTADFSMWCDDVYSYTQDEYEYVEPIMSMQVTFNGSGKVTYSNYGPASREMASYGSRIESVTSVNDNNLKGFNEAKYADKLYFDSNGLTIESKGLVIKNANGDDVFYADDEGNLTLNGAIKSDSGNIGSWDILNKYIRCERSENQYIEMGLFGDFPNIFMSSSIGVEVDVGEVISQIRMGGESITFQLEYGGYGYPVATIGASHSGSVDYFDIDTNGDRPLRINSYNTIISHDLNFQRIDSTTSSANACFVSSEFGNKIVKVSSLKEVKDNIETIENPTEKVDNLRGVHFTSKCKGDDPKQVFYGFIAEEVEKAVPELATYDNGKLQSVQYDRVCALLVEDNKACHRRIEELEARIKEIERKLGL